MVYRLGKNGKFLSCTGYPECRAAKNVDKHGKPIEPVIVETPCDVCGKAMQLKKSKRGPFLGCTGYPDCTNTKPCDDEGHALRKVDAAEIKVSCPECNSPMSVKFARGRAFLGCTAYPRCKATAPMPEGVYVEKPKPEEAGVRCDKCGRNMVIRKSRRGPFLSCSGFPRCRNAMPMDKLEHLRSLEAEGKIPDAPVENGAATNGRGRKSAGKPKILKKEELASLGPPPKGFAWTRTGRPVVEVPPEGHLACFDCGDEMVLRTGRFGPFYACTNAKCKAVANLRGDAKKQAEAQTPEARAKPIETEEICPDCGSKMLLRMGRTGRFLGCSNYPKCRKTREAPAGLLREVGAELAGAR
jgi:ssDNA-binding Zn-finger/Zn-ribbon topoisomerase 1